MNEVLKFLIIEVLIEFLSKSRYYDSFKKSLFLLEQNYFLIDLMVLMIEVLKFGMIKVSIGFFRKPKYCDPFNNYGLRKLIARNNITDV